PGAARTVLLLLDAGKGNIPFTDLLPAADNNLLEWMIEYATEEQFRQLPPYDVVFNAIGEPDVTARTAPAVARFLAGCSKPVLNAPAAVARTARHLLPDLLAGVDGLLVPAVWRIEAGAGWRARPEFRFPALLRPPATHGGEGMRQVDSRAALDAIEIAPGAALYMCAYHDYRSADGHFRKYRIMFVDRQPYPYHLAISEQWMVHYASAAMLSPWKLDEERRFLEDPAAILGAAGMAAIAAIGRRLDLDYAGVDFSLLPDGRLLIFEANATML
ncbi:MAG TPA: hypothetical protein DCW29_19900, partial [Janthinobacterium sp.]|nr:hypothetical protein [Janthinobacterium sp.]